MEPNDRTWFIVYSARYFRVKVTPGTPTAAPIPLDIELVTGNVQTSFDYVEEVHFPWVSFKMYRGAGNRVTGAELSRLPTQPPPPILHPTLLRPILQTPGRDPPLGPPYT